MTDKKKNDKPYWYRIYISECPVCGKGEETRERRYDERPKDPEDRYEYSLVYDGCLGY